MKKLFSAALSLIMLVSVFCTAVFADEQEQITLNLSVYEEANGKYLAWKPDLTVTADSSVLGVLEAAGLSVALNGDVITSINGFANGQYGENSRWSFTVNGVSTNISASKYIPVNGDKIDLRYLVPEQPASDTTAPQNSNTPTNASDYTKITQNTTAPSESATTQTTETTAISATAVTENTFPQNVTTQTATISQNDVISSALAFAKSNKSSFNPLVLSCYSQAIGNNIKNDITTAAEKSETLTPPELSILIINAAAIGLNPNNTGDVDLADQLINEQNVMKSGLYGAIYGKFALSHCKADDEETIKAANTNMIKLILQNQNDDGSFSLTYGEKPDVGLTALSISALADNIKNADVSSAVDKALLWLINEQNPDGSFSDANGNPDCTATARVIIALRTLDIKITDERFVRDNNTYDALLKFFNGTAFSKGYNGTADAAATESALLALFSYNHSGNPYTFRINSHLEQLNIWLFGITAVVLLAALGIVLYLMKKKGFFNMSGGSKTDKPYHKGDKTKHV